MTNRTAFILFISSLFFTSCSTVKIKSSRELASKSNCLKEVNSFFRKIEMSKAPFHPIKDIYAKSNQLEKEVYEGLFAELQNQQFLIDKIKKSKITPAANFITFLNGQPTHSRIKARKGFFGKLSSVGQDFVLPFAKFLSPVPIPANWGRGPTYKILRKLWKNSNYKPTNEEIEILKKFETYEYYLRVQMFFKKHPNLKGVRKAIAVTAESARTTTVIAASIYAYEQMNGGLLDVDTFLDDPRYKLEDNQVQLIIDTVPFPHTAIRIGNTIYSYGQTHLTATPIIQYIKNREYNKAIKERMLRAGIKVPGEEVVDTSDLPLKDRLSAQLSGLTSFLMDKSGLGDLPKSLQVVTIHLSKEERDNLKRELVLNTANRYENKTFVNDCATMVFRAMEKTTEFDFQNRLWDASPSQSAMILSLMKAAGSDRVGPIYQVAVEETDKPVKHLARNTYINVLESYLFIELFHFNQTHRAFIDLTLSENELQSRDKETNEYIKKWEQDITDLMQRDLQLMIIKDQVSRFSALPEDEKDVAATEFKESIDFVFGKYINKAHSLVESKESDFQTIILNEYKLEYLNGLKNDLLEKLD